MCIQTTKLIIFPQKSRIFACLTNVVLQRDDFDFRLSSKMNYTKTYCAELGLARSIISFCVFPSKSALWIFRVVYFTFLGNRILLCSMSENKL